LEFVDWPSVPDKTVFKELTNALYSKHKLRMSQAYIDTVAPHLNILVKNDYTLNEILKICTSKGWKTLMSNWFEDKKVKSSVNIVATTPDQYINLILEGQISHVSQIGKVPRELIDSMYRNGRYEPTTMYALEQIGFTV